MVTGGLLWQWIGGHLPGCGGDGSFGLRAVLNMVHWTQTICGYMGVAVNECGCYSCYSAREMVLVVPTPFGFT